MFSLISKTHLIKKCLKPIVLNSKLLFHFSSNSNSIRSIDEVRVRFAPSPTGRLHIGGLRTALYNYLFATKHKGKFILRIEDTDQERLKPGSVEFLLASLDWVGIRPQYGPHIKNSDDSSQGAPFQQSLRLNIYEEYSQKLVAAKKAYHCFCDETRLELLRREATKRQEKISYDGKCRHLSEETVQKYLAEGRKSVIRFKLEDKNIIFNDMTMGVHSSNPGRNEGDFIIIKSDGFPTYHFAHVVDDHLMRISHVLRGQEWLLSTPKHIALFEAFGWQHPQYGHLPLICNMDGTKLSKRQNDIDVLSYKERGYFAETLLVYLSSIGGGLKVNVQECEEFFESSQMILPRLAEAFDESRIGSRSVKLNQELLDRLNRRFLQLKLCDQTETLNLIDQLKNLLKQNVPNLSEQYLNDEYLKTVLTWSVERIFRVKDLATEPGFSFLWTDLSSSSSLEIDEITRAKMLELVECLREYLRNQEAGGDLFEDKQIFQKSISKVFKDLKENSRIKDEKKTNYWQMIRLILTGDVNGPPVFEIFNILKEKNIRFRLEIASSILKEKK